MIRVTVVRKNGSITGYFAKGHAEYAELGSDIVCAAASTVMQNPLAGMQEVLHLNPQYGFDEDGYITDRKSTRLNSSHANISYAVFCLKKKTKQIERTL